MTKEMKNIPTIRFKNFTDAWEQRKFQEITRRCSKMAMSTGKNSAVEYEDVVPESGLLNKNIKLKNIYKKGISFDKNKILYGKLRPYLHHWLNPQFKGVAVGDWWVLTPVNIDKGFLYRLIQTQKFDEVANQSSGSKMPRADWNLVANTDFIVPQNIAEQKEIGAFFSQLDYLITLHQRKLDHLNKLKTYFLQNLFPAKGEKVPKVRFKEFTGDWEQRKLRDIAERVVEKNVALTDHETFTNSAEFGIISQTNFFDHGITNEENIGNYYIVHSDDFVYNPRISVKAPVGPINRNKLGRSGVMSPLYIIFRSHDIDTNYLEYYFKTNYWHSFMHFNGDTGARSDRFNIKIELFYEMPIPTPEVDEQRKIGNLLEIITDIITLHQHQLDQLQSFKKFMLQNMFV